MHARVPALSEVSGPTEADSVLSIRNGRAHKLSSPVDALVLDAKERQSLVMVRELGRAGLSVGAVGSDHGAAAFSSRWCGFAAVLPHMNHEPRAYADGLLSLLDRYRARAVIPSSDGAVEVLRAHRATIERHTGLAIGSEQALYIAVSKPRTLAIAAELGIAVPRSIPLADPGDVPNALKEIGYPAVLKPQQSWVERDGIANRLVCRAVRNADDAKRYVEEVAEVGGALVAQEWLPGAREAISLIYANGRVWARFAQVAHRMLPPLGGSSVLRESIALPADAAGGAEQLIRTINLEGYSEVEFRRDRAGRPVLMEINPRLSASVEIAIRSGINFPLLLYQWAAGEPLEAVTEYRQGIRMRWLGGDVRYLRETLMHQGEPDVPPIGRTIGTFLLDFARPAAYDYIDAGDLRPALLTTWHTLIRPAMRLVSKVRP